MHKYISLLLLGLLLAVAAIAWPAGQTGAQSNGKGHGQGQGLNYHGKVTLAERKAAADQVMNGRADKSGGLL